LCFFSYLLPWSRRLLFLVRGCHHDHELS
jgi:hypothetical protein